MSAAAPVPPPAAAGPAPGRPAPGVIERWYSRVQRALTVILIAAAVLVAAAWLFKGRLPTAAGIAPELQQEPRQEPTARAPFVFAYRGCRYQVTPVAAYELWGLVVSHNDIYAISDIYHDKNSVDVKDVCVIWGPNVQHDDFRRVQYRSNCYTCEFHYRWGVTFDHFAIANTHLLTSDPAVLRQIAAVRRADQIHLTGLLVNYGPEGKGWERRTSTTRRDEGMGACEVMFVEQLEFVRRGTPWWYFSYQWGRLVLAVVVLVKAGLFVGKALVDQRAYERRLAAG